MKNFRKDAPVMSLGNLTGADSSMVEEKSHDAPIDKRPQTKIHLCIKQLLCD
jgi:hypothetical protein